MVQDVLPRVMLYAPHPTLNENGGGIINGSTVVKVSGLE